MHHAAKWWHNPIERSIIEDYNFVLICEAKEKVMYIYECETLVIVGRETFGRSWF